MANFISKFVYHSKIFEVSYANCVKQEMKFLIVFALIEMKFEFSYNLPNEIVDVYNIHITNFSNFKFRVIFVLQIA